MAMHERAVEVAASQDEAYRLLSDRHRIPEYLLLIARVEEHGPDSVTLTVRDRDGITRRAVVRAHGDSAEMRIAWELDVPRIRGEIAVAPGPDLEGWNHCIVRAMVDDSDWPGLPAGFEARSGATREPGNIGGTPGREGMALGPAPDGRRYHPRRPGHRRRHRPRRSPRARAGPAPRPHHGRRPPHVTDVPDVTAMKDVTERHRTA